MKCTACKADAHYEEHGRAWVGGFITAIIGETLESNDEVLNDLCPKHRASVCNALLQLGEIVGVEARVEEVSEGKFTIVIPERPVVNALVSSDECFLCTSPVPENQDDANYAYLAGVVDGLTCAAKKNDLVKLCAAHRAKLAELCERHRVTLDASPPPARAIPAKNSILAFVHCVTCLRERPEEESPRSYARLEFGWTELGLQIRCVRHELNVMHIDFQGHRHPSNGAGIDEPVAVTGFRQ